ncbi:MAG: phosphotransferase [Chloroflexi bacterium]|nr:phosphotransferase [Chloroflexota bacterium]
MITGLHDVLASSGQEGLAELREVVSELLGGNDGTGRLTGEHQLARFVYRLGFTVGGRDRSLIVKRLNPGIAQRNQLVATRWLPAIDLSQGGPPIVGVAAERSGRCVWHVYQDLGDCALEAKQPDPKRVEAAVALIARIHTRFVGHALLPECRLYGDDFGISFYASNVRDAINSLRALRPPAVELSAEHLAVRERVLDRLRRLLDEQPERARVLADWGGPETMLHGDLWNTNALVVPADGGLHARLIDWDHVGVGPVSYDLSTFLSRFPARERRWVLDLYSRAVGRGGWMPPAAAVLNGLFETAEYARLANRVIWPAIAVLDGHVDWGFEHLAMLDRWFEMVEPVLPLEREG